MQRILILFAALLLLAGGVAWGMLTGWGLGPIFLIVSVLLGLGVLNEMGGRRGPPA